MTRRRFGFRDRGERKKSFKRKASKKNRRRDLCIAYFLDLYETYGWLLEFKRDRLSFSPVLGVSGAGSDSETERISLPFEDGMDGRDGTRREWMTNNVIPYFIKMASKSQTFGGRLISVVVVVVVVVGRAPPLRRARGRLETELERNREDERCPRRRQSGE